MAGINEMNDSTIQRFQGYDRIMGSISWLLIALVALAVKIMPETDGSSLVVLGSISIILFMYNIVVRYGSFACYPSQFKTFVDLMVFLAFIVAVCWCTGKLTSPFMSLIYLILMATALTQGKRVTYLMSALAVASYVLLASADLRELNFYLTHTLEIFPYMLIAHLGAMLAGETESARKEVERLSLTDEVTGINNMRNFFLLADVQEKIAKRYSRQFAVCMIDADGLKKVNDRYGHLAGTELIRQVASMISQNIRSSDICARYGGDEYVIMFNETNKYDVSVAVERIIQGMAAGKFNFEGHLIGTTLSAGLASFPDDGNDIKSVMANADEAMYYSKKTGKNRLTLYTPECAVIEEIHPVVTEDDRL